jgi:hypothetical protein
MQCCLDLRQETFDATPATYLLLFDEFYNERRPTRFSGAAGGPVHWLSIQNVPNGWIDCRAHCGHNVVAA